MQTDELEQAQGLLEIVRTAAEHLPDSLWSNEKWSASFIATFGGQILKHDSFMMMVPSVSGQSEPAEEPRLVVYLHGFTQS
jgi:hypothetical protein